MPSLIDSSNLSGYAKFYSEGRNNGLSDEEAHTYANMMNSGSGITSSDIDNIVKKTGGSNDYKYNSSGYATTPYDEPANVLKQQIDEQQISYDNWLREQNVIQKQMMQQQSMQQQLMQQQQQQSLLGSQYSLPNFLSNIDFTPKQSSSKQSFLTQEKGLLKSSNFNTSKSGGTAYMGSGMGGAINRYMGGDMWKSKYKGY